jgi:hypothetical protein
VISRSTIGPIEFIGDKNDIVIVEPAWISISRKGGSEPKPCEDVMDAPRQRKNFLAGIMFRYRHKVICRSVGTLLRERV